MTQLEIRTKEYGVKCHEKTNHFYGDNKSYSFHLEMVNSFANKYIHLLPVKHRENALCACWVHDVIEDARQTYNDVKNATTEAIADIAFALTNEKGKTRKDRGNEKYYEGIRNTPVAMFVKICDRLSNANHSKNTGSSMLNAYRKENEYFKKQLFCSEYKEMFDELEQILNYPPLLTLLHP